jgi:hypothetical protein
MRDYVAEVRAIVDTETERGPYVTGQVADKVIKWLRHHDPELLQGFLDTQAVQLVCVMIRDRDRSARSHARAVAGRSVFRGALAQFADGDPSALNRWLTMPIVLDGNVRKPLAELTAEDLNHAADRYHHHAQRNAMMATFLRTLSAKVSDGTVADYYTDEQLATMWRSLG